MNKTSTIAIIILILLIIFLVWSGKLNLFKKQNNLQAVIPESSIMAFKVNNLEQFRNIAKESKFIKTFQNLAWVNNFDKSSAMINELLSLELGNFKQQKIVASLHAVKSGQYGFLYLIDSENIGSNPFKLFRRSLKSDDDHQLKTSRFKKTLIYHTQTGLNNFEKMSFSQANGVILFSKHATLVEEGIKAILDNETLNTSFIPTYKHNKNANSLGFTLNTSNLKMFLTPNELDDKKLINNQILKFLNAFNGDLVVSKNRLKLDGNLNINNNEWLKALNRHLPINSPTLIKKIPSNCANFTYCNVSNFQTFFDDYLESMNILQANKFTPYLIATGNEFVKVKLTQNADNVMVVAIRDIELLKKNYTKISANYNSGTNYDIRKLDDNDFANLLLQEKNDTYFYTILGSSLLISNSKTAISNLATKIVSGNSFDKTNYYKSYSENFMLKSSLIHFANPPKLKNYYTNGWEELKNRNVNIDEIYPLFMQIYDVKRSFNLNAILGFKGAGLDEGIEFENRKKPIFETKPVLTENPKVRKTQNNEIENAADWSNILQERAIIKPQPFVNHYTNENETFIQDLNNTIYLLNKKNEIIWKRNITSKIKTPILMVDFLKNNKNQLFFNTENRLFLLDRNGNGVKPFPKNLSANAQNAIKKVYYKDAKKERYYYAGTDKKTHALDKYGNKVNGWNNNINVGNVELPMAYITSAGKDFLCFVNNNQQLFIFNRRGELRKEVIDLNLSSKPIKMELATKNGSTNLKVTDSNGKEEFVVLK